MLKPLSSIRLLKIYRLHILVFIKQHVNWWKINFKDTVNNYKHLSSSYQNENVQDLFELKFHQVVYIATLPDRA